MRHIATRDGPNHVSVKAVRNSHRLKYGEVFVADELSEPIHKTYGLAYGKTVKIGAGESLYDLITTGVATSSNEGVTLADEAVRRIVAFVVDTCVEYGVRIEQSHPGFGGVPDYLRAGIVQGLQDVSIKKDHSRRYAVRKAK
jgi:hypothetical protein